MSTPAADSRTRPLRRARHQHGVTLIDALLAFLVLAAGVLSMGKLQLQLQATPRASSRRPLLRPLLRPPCLAHLFLDQSLYRKRR